MLPEKPILDYQPARTLSFRHLLQSLGGRGWALLGVVWLTLLLAGLAIDWVLLGGSDGDRTLVAWQALSRSIGGGLASLLAIRALAGSRTQLAQAGSAAQNTALISLLYASLQLCAYPLAAAGVATLTGVSPLLASGVLWGGYVATVYFVASRHLGTAVKVAAEGLAVLCVATVALGIVAWLAQG